MNLNQLSPDIRDQVERILAFTPMDELPIIPFVSHEAPKGRVAEKWLEAGLLFPKEEVKGFRPVRRRVK